METTLLNIEKRIGSTLSYGKQLLCKHQCFNIAIQVSQQFNKGAYCHENNWNLSYTNIFAAS
jgi:hypothetical protein